jgi:DNA-binding HxlR family transcriptional regulator
MPDHVEKPLAPPRPPKSAAQARRLEGELSTSFPRFCSVAGTVEILSDPWSFLVLREGFFGTRRFEKFQSMLGVSRTTLAKILKKLSALGLLRKEQYSSHPRRFEYRFTDKGRELYPVMLTLLKFGDKWLCSESPPPLRLFHKECGYYCSPLVVCSHCGTEILPRRVHYRDVPGAGRTPHQDNWTRCRRVSDPATLQRVRPCSVARSLIILGDRWTFLILRDAFFGIRRYEELRARLGIATNILTDRLARLTEQDILVKMLYQESPERFEYRLTEKGKDFYGPFLVMMRWGDKWLAGGKPTLKLRHRDCGRDFQPLVVCDHCHRELDPRQMGFALSYVL